MLPGVSRPPEYLVPGSWDAYHLIEKGDWLMKLERRDGRLEIVVDESGQPVLMGQVSGYVDGDNQTRVYGRLGAMATQDTTRTVKVLFGKEVARE
eukprot:1320221-Alexandrium_andersonii.AAC.1